MSGEQSNRQVLCDIAKTAFDVVSGLLERDRLLAEELRTSETTSRQIYREECITVEMAAALRERFPKAVQITLFTPAEEARTGADWYWRFEKGTEAIHARVQAKRVQRTAFGQSDTEGHVEIDHNQLGDLIQATSAATNELQGIQAWLASFVRFDATPPCGNENLSDCSRHNHRGSCPNNSPSVWIAQAAELRALGVTRLQIRQLVEKSVRLDCVLPCLDATNGTGGPAAKGFVLQGGLPSFRDCVTFIQADPVLRKQIEGAMCIAV